MSTIYWEDIAGIWTYFYEENEEIGSGILCINCIEDEDKANVLHDGIITKDKIKEDKKECVYFCDRCGNRLDHLDHFQQIKK